MAKLTISSREKWAIKWHLNGATVPDRVHSRSLDAIWDALKLDEEKLPVSLSIEALNAIDDADAQEFEISSTERDHLIGWMNAPMNGTMSRLLSKFDRRLMKSRDG